MKALPVSAILLISTLTLSSWFSGCSGVQKAARDTQYSAYELVGVQKRDLLKKRVDDAKEEQEEAGEKFGTALERLKALSGFEGGDLEKQYNSLKSAYDKAADQAQDVSKSVKAVETVASDLFDEWEKEIGEIQTESLRSKSRQTLADTRKRYNELHANLKRSEARMQPVLEKFNDQVLYLKHNLNAQAISSLRGEATNIQSEIEKLIGDMNKSIAAADRFIEQMP